MMCSPDLMRGGSRRRRALDLKVLTSHRFMNCFTWFRRKDFAMKILTTPLNSRTATRFSMLLAVILALGTVALPYAAPPQAVTLTIVNNTSRDIRHVYVAPANSDNWGADQLNNSSIAPGVSRTLNINWDQPTVKLVAEDQDGCFITTTVSSAGTIDWTITNSTPRDCG